MRDEHRTEVYSPNVSPADHFTYHQEHKPPWGESSFAQLSFLLLYKNLPFQALLVKAADTSFSNGTTSSQLYRIFG